MDELLTVGEVARYLKLSRATVWRWCQDGKLSASKVGRGWRVHRASVEALVSSAPLDPDCQETMQGKVGEM